jgi:hypothetical protein
MVSNGNFSFVWACLTFDMLAGKYLLQAVLQLDFNLLPCIL